MSITSMLGPGDDDGNGGVVMDSAHKREQNSRNLTETPLTSPIQGPKQGRAKQRPSWSGNLRAGPR